MYIFFLLSLLLLFLPATLKNISLLLASPTEQEGKQLAAPHLIFSLLPSNQAVVGQWPSSLPSSRLQLHDKLLFLPKSNDRSMGMAKMRNMARLQQARKWNHHKQLIFDEQLISCYSLDRLLFPPHGARSGWEGHDWEDWKDERYLRTLVCRQNRHPARKLSGSAVLSPTHSTWYNTAAARCFTSHHAPKPPTNETTAYQSTP